MVTLTLLRSLSISIATGGTLKSIRNVAFIHKLAILLVEGVSLSKDGPEASAPLRHQSGPNP